MLKVEHSACMLGRDADVGGVVFFVQHELVHALLRLCEQQLAVHHLATSVEPRRRHQTSALVGLGEDDVGKVVC